MSNICKNIAYFQTTNENDINAIHEAILGEFSVSSDTSLDDMALYAAEMEFESHWSYPDEFFDNLFASLEQPEKLYFRCLSHELSNEYVAFNIFGYGSWEDTQLAYYYHDHYFLKRKQQENNQPTN